VGYAEAPTTIEAPYHEASEGLRHALADLEAITGREFLDDSARLLMPATTDGRGVDTFVATSSAGPAVRALLVGLLPDVSLEAARRAAAGSYVQIVDRFSLGDTRGEDQQIDAVIAARPELMLIAGGTDGGASDALLKLVETISLACHLLPPGSQSRALFAGNTALQARTSELLGRVAQVRSSANVLPALDREQLAPARAELGRLYEELRVAQLGGFYDLAQAAGGRIVPSAQAEGHYVRFLSKLPAWPRGVLSVNAGSANTSVAAAWNGQLHLCVRTGLGVGLGAADALAEAPLDQLTRWLPYALDEDAARAFVLNKSAYPHTVPADSEDLWLELALARYVIRAAVRRARPDWPENVPGPRPELLPWFSLIIGGGATLGRAPRPGLAALVLLDALQPAGVTRLMVDPYHLTAALGATAYANPLVTAQVQDSLSLLDLGTAVSLIGRGRLGEAACHVRLVEESGAARELEVAYGALEVLPLPLGRSGKLTIRPRTGFNAGVGLGRGRSLTVMGGALGVVVDARGRPVGLPRAAEQRQEMVRQWTLKLNSA
jgi:hypothetical protein